MPARTTVIASAPIPVANPLCKFFLTALVVLACLGIASESLAQRRNDKQLRKREVKKVRIEGNAGISTNELSEWITTRPSSWIERTLNKISSSFGRPRQYVDEAILMSDTESISDYYHAKGYLEVRVSFRFDENQDDVAEWNRIRDKNRFLPPSQQDPYPDIRTTVVFLINEGPAYKVAGFTFEGLEGLPFDLLEHVTEDLGIARGTQYSAEAVVKEDERVRALLGENGYPFFHRDSIIVESIAGTKTVGITVYFQTGHRYRMGDLRIVYDTLGAEGRVKESVIRRQIPYEKGSWVKLSVLSEGERNLYSLGTFDLAFVYPDTSVASGLPDSLKDGQEVPIVVELRTQITVDIAPGVFVASSGRTRSALAAGASIAYNHRNLFGGAEKFSAQLSLQPFPTSQFRADAGATFEFPYVGSLHVPLSIGANFSHIEEDNEFLERSYSGRIGLRYTIPHVNISIRPSVTLEYLRRRIFNSELLTTLKDLPNYEQFNLITGASGIYDITNDFINPSRGTNVSLGLEFGIPLSTIFREDLPSASYFKTSLQGRQFFDLDGIGKSILALRVLGGKVFPFEPENSARDIPVLRRFLIGGPSSLRGWPSLVLLMSNDTAKSAPKFGGYTTAEANVEWRFAPFRYEDAFSFFEKLLSDLRTGLFIDVGNLWDKGTPFSFKDLAIAGGAGLRYNTIFGAIRFDVGFKIYDPAPGLDEGTPHATQVGTPGVWIWNRKFIFDKVGQVQFTLGLPF